jgi:4-amino-4-deoxy-L-arabinose transferase-like glycosyltransferase
MAQSVTALPTTASGFQLILVALYAVAVAAAGNWSLPPLDRDEARFAQATAQMLETGDLITIRFQDAERNKKPVGIHWLQAASVEAFSSVEDREIWAYRLPSLAGFVLAAVFTTLAGTRLFGANCGLLAGLLLASAPGAAGEATIAKTDAMLLAAVCIAQTAFIYVFADAERGKRGWFWPALFWFALAAGILLKGPIAPMIVGLTGAVMFFRRPNLGWLRAFRPLAGLAILSLTVLPWALAIGVATEGRFFTEAIGDDMLAKVSEAQERHSGPFGYHFLLAWFLLWPAAGLIVPGVAHAIATRAAWPSWFLIGWIVPSWLVFEATATKLPHYTLPLYPALAILAARAAAVGVAGRRRFVRRAGAAIYLLGGVLVVGLVVALPILLAGERPSWMLLALAGLIAAATAVSAREFWQGRSYRGGIFACFIGAGVAWTLLEGVLPHLDKIDISRKASAALEEAGLHPLRNGARPATLSGYYEPSAVFLLGTDTRLAGGAEAGQLLVHETSAAAIVEAREEEAFHATISESNASVSAVARISGLNYSNGRSVALTIYILER